MQRYAIHSWTIICSTGQWPKTHLHAVLGLFYQEGEWWSGASDDLASPIPRPQPNWDGKTCKNNEKYNTNISWSSKRKEDQGTLHIINLNAFISMACSIETTFFLNRRVSAAWPSSGSTKKRMSSFEQLFQLVLIERRSGYKIVVTKFQLYQLN